MSALKFLLPGEIPQEEFDAIKIEVYDVAPGILMLTGLGGNVGVSYGEDLTFMIDGQFGPLVEKIMAAIATRTNHPVQYLLNTHWHLDHVAANEELAKRGIMIMAHDNVRVRLSADQPLPAFGLTVPAAAEKALPAVTFPKNLALYWNQDRIEIFHIPDAHTDGDVMVHFQKGNVIHMSDIYFNGMYPLIDTDCGGSIDGMIRAVDEVLARSDENTKIIPGHGPLSGRSELQDYRDMLAVTRDAVSILVGQGKSRKDVIAAKPTAAMDAVWGGGVLQPDAYAGLVYDSLAKI